MMRRTMELIEKAAMRHQIETKSRQKQKAEQSKRVITVSRMFGAGGISVSNLLGKHLGWTVWDREILNVLASESNNKYQAQMFEALDEKTQGVIESFLSSAGGGLGKETYLYLLQRAVYTITQNDAIILGRGAHLILPNALNVFLKASMETRVKNVMKLLDVATKEAEKEIERRQQERDAFLEEIHQKFGAKSAYPHQGLHYDLEINTDRFDAKEATQIVMEATKACYKLK